MFKGSSHITMVAFCHKHVPHSHLAIRFSYRRELKKSHYITDTDTEGEVRVEVLGTRSQTDSRFQEAMTYMNILEWCSLRQFYAHIPSALRVRMKHCPPPSERNSALLHCPACWSQPRNVYGPCSSRVGHQTHTASHAEALPHPSLLFSGSL